MGSITPGSSLPSVSNLLLPQSILELVKIIQEHAITLENYSTANNIHQPFSNAASTGIFPSQSSPAHIQDARVALISATRSLQDLVLGPAGVLEDINANDVLCLQAIHRYHIASCFLSHETISFEELSNRCGLNVTDLKRILRLAMTRRVFSEPHPGFVAHTASSRLLSEDSRMRDFSGIICEERFPASARSVDALLKYGQSQATNQSGFSLANNTDCGLYEELKKWPDRQARWNSAMSAMANQIDFDFLVNSFPWTSYGPGTVVVDVGGGNGTISIGLAKRLPHLQFIVQDVNIPDTPLPISEPLSSRLTFNAHYDFFKEQTTMADIYYFRNIFHNWPDEQCLQILRNHVHVMCRTTKLVIDDFALHDPLTVSPYEERRRRSMDITMLIYFGSRERTIQEWGEMVKKADARFELQKVTTDPKQPNALLEIGWNGE